MAGVMHRSSIWKNLLLEVGNATSYPHGFRGRLEREKSMPISLLKIVAALLSLCGLFSGMASGQGGAANHVREADLDKETLDHLFVGYPQSYDLKIIITLHARREPMEKSQVTFLSTWFVRGNPRAAMTTVVNNEGRVFTYPKPLSDPDRIRCLWDEQLAIDLPTFLAVVGTLPENTPPIALADLVIVSFRLDGKWHTRLYDRKKAPAPLTRIYQLANSLLDGN
jgi:hypothetical protein